MKNEMFLLLIAHPGTVQEDDCFFSYKFIKVSPLFLRAVHLNITLIHLNVVIYSSLEINCKHLFCNFFPQELEIHSWLVFLASI